MKASRMNNLKLRFQRTEMIYEAVMTDLALMGAIPKNVCEALTGHVIPEGIELPDEVKEAINDARSKASGSSAK